jgi:predicted RNA methylase
MTQTDAANYTTYVTKGLADLACQEIIRLTGRVGSITDVTERFLLCSLDQAELHKITAQARLIDDLRLLVAEPRQLTGPSDFAEFCAVAAEETINYLKATNPSQESSKWSITISARNPLWRTDDWSPAPIINQYFHCALPDDTQRSPVDLRLQIEGDLAHISVNLQPKPYQHPAAGQAVNRMGSLRPSVTAAMVQLAMAATELPAQKNGIYDPFCGSGTIVAEAALAGLPIFASDIDPAAVELTRTRLAPLFKANPDVLIHRVFQHNIEDAWPKRVNSQFVVGNMPWGKQIQIKQLSKLIDSLMSVIATTISKGGVAVILTGHPEALVSKAKKLDVNILESRQIGLLGQTPTIMVFYSHRKAGEEPSWRDFIGTFPKGAINEEALEDFRRVDEKMWL